MDHNKYQSALQRFDEANLQDPHTELYNGKECPKEWVYSQRMSQWLEQLAPDASEPLRLAARCQHIRRWTIPRESYPATKPGYKQWRSDLAKFHAKTAGEILTEVGYGADTIERVQALLQKQNLKTDPETQTLEDVICVVFVENYMRDFAKQHEESKLLTILRKTWKKMSLRGHEAILGLELSPEAQQLLDKALAE